MVKTPRTRHSKTKREPVTIELEPGSVSRVADESEAATTPSGFEDAPATDEKASASASDDSSKEAAVEAKAGDPETSSSSDYNLDETPPNDRDTDGERAQSQPEPASTAPRSGSRLPVFAAGVVGAIVALVAAGLLQYAGILGTPRTQVASDPGSSQLEGEIATLKSEVAALRDNPATGSGVDPATVENLSGAVEQVKTEVASLQKAVESGSAGDTAGLEALRTRIEDIDSRLAGQAQNASGPSPEDIAALNERIAAIEAQVKSADEANTAIDGRLGAFEQSLQGLSSKVEAQAGQPKIALAIASSALKSAIERGVPFQSEIETFAAIAPESPDIADLRTYAEDGVATQAELVAETDAAANAMIAAAAPPKKDAGIVERLLTSAESLVSVRPIGAVEGDGVPEIVARMEVAIQAGDLEKALAEYETLPEPAKAAGAAFAERIRARVQVEKLADQAVAGAMQAE